MAERARALPLYPLLLVPGALVLYFSFNAGGFFPRSVALAVIVMAQALVLYMSLATNPFGRLSWPAVLACSGLALFALFVLASQLWSDAPGRSLLEFNRALLYVVVLVLFTLVGGVTGRLRMALRFVAAAIVIVGACALISRVAPDLWPTDAQLQNQRLSWPLTYWNALGIVAAMGAILSFHLACDDEEPPLVRVLAAASVPIVTCTLLFTFSRGPIIAGSIGVVVYLLAARPRALLTGVVATVPPTVIALVTAYNAELLSTRTPTTPAATAQGHHVLRVLVACVVGAALLRALLLLVDARRDRTLPEYLPARARQAGIVLAAVAALVTAGALVDSGWVSRTWDSFWYGTSGGGSLPDLRQRLTLASGNGRGYLDRAGLDGFRDARLHGNGAGTFELTWQQYRPFLSQAVDAHSLYFESLSEFGVIGLALLLVVVLTLLAGSVVRARGPDRAVYGAVFAMSLAWALHAGVDWDWEMPATVIPVIALGGLALGNARSRLAAVKPPAPDTRMTMAFACILCLVVPFLVLGSQSRLNDGLFAFRNSDCPTAIGDAADSMNWLAVRSEAYQVMAYCALQSRFPVEALQAARKAHSYDPSNWETEAWLGISQAAAGKDPRPLMNRAASRNPRLKVIQDVARLLDSPEPSVWRARARQARRTLIESGEMAITNPN